jgi:hypothetical protein
MAAELLSPYPSRKTQPRRFLQKRSKRGVVGVARLIGYDDDRGKEQRKEYESTCSREGVLTFLSQPETHMFAWPPIVSPKLSSMIVNGVSFNSMALRAIVRKNPRSYASRAFQN